MSEHVTIEDNDRIRVIRMNRPERKNALTIAMYTRMADALREADADPNIRCTVLAGTDDTFTAGNDLGDFVSNPPTDETSPVFQFLLALIDAKKPVVCAVEGLAIGIGTTLLLHCDLSYAGAGARFKLPFVDLGAVPEAGSSLLLPSIMGTARAAELLMLCPFFDAARAESLGLLTRAVPAGEAFPTAMDAARTLATKAPAALQRTRALLHQHDPKLRERLALEARWFADCLKGPEFQEAVTAFNERRPADFSRF